MQEFENRIAVVTGAAQGLGFATAKLLIDRGASVALLDADSAALKKAATAFDPEQAHAVVNDVTDEKSVIASRDEVYERFGHVDILVNNAGIYPHATLREITMPAWDQMFDVNVKGAFLTTRAYMDDMAERGYGRVVCIVTIDAYRAKPTLPHYAASKAALGNLIKTFAVELAPHGVLVNGVSPGAIATERAKSQSWLAERIKTIPVGHAAEPEDIAEVVLFLASSRNRFVVGETVIACGGIYMD